jgi:hypothetical protein
MFPRRGGGLHALVLTLIALLFVALPAVADTLLVPEDFSFDAALSAAASGDTVSVAAGTLEYAMFSLPPGIVLLSREPWTNSISRLLAWDLVGKSEVHGFRFTAYPYWNPAAPIWLGVIVDNSEVWFSECHFEGLDSEVGEAGGIDYPGGASWRWPLEFRNDSNVFLNSCSFSENTSNGNDYFGTFACIASVTSILEIFNCTFEQQDRALYSSNGSVILTESSFRECHDEFLRVSGPLTMLGNLIVNCGPRYWETPGYLKDGVFKEGSCEKTPSIYLSGSVQLQSNTFVDNPVLFPPYYQWCSETFPEPDDRLALVILEPNTRGAISRNLFIGLTGPAVDAPASIVVSCNDVWDGLGQYWTGGIGDVTGTDGNISEAPIFCGRNVGDYTLSLQSPAATAECGPMGAFPAACDRALEIPDQGGSEPQGQPAKLQTRLLGAAPNPFNPRTQIRFELEHAGDVHLEIFDVAGRLVRGWSLQQLAAGPHSISWDGDDAHGKSVASGAYHLRLLYEGKVLSGRMALLR